MIAFLGMGSSLGHLFSALDMFDHLLEKRICDSSNNAQNSTWVAEVKRTPQNCSLICFWSLVVFGGPTVDVDEIRFGMEF